MLAITAVLATATVFERLGWVGEDKTLVHVLAAVVVAVLIVLGAMAGYHIIMKMQSVLTWVTGITTIIYVLLVLPHIKWDAIMAIPSGPPAAMIGA